MADSELRMANVGGESSEESAVEFFDRWALIMLRHKLLYLLIAVAVVGGYSAKELLVTSHCRTSWLIRSSADPDAMQTVSAALGSSAQIKKKGSGLIQIVVWGPRETCGLPTVVRTIADLRNHLDKTIGETIGEPTTDYNRRPALAVLARAVLAAMAVVALVVVVVDAMQRGWRHVLALNKIAKGE